MFARAAEDGPKVHRRRGARLAGTTGPIAGRETDDG